MEVKVQNLNAVDRQITILATREDLQEQFDKAYKSYRGKINLPGFRSGQVPVKVIRQRFGREIEFDEITKFLNKVFEKDIAPEHSPVGESRIEDLKWENDRLEAIFKIGVRPDFELTALSKVKVNRLVHDVSDKEVDEEIDKALQRIAPPIDVDEKITSDHVVVVDAVTLDENKNPIESQTDRDQRIDLAQPGAADFLKSLKGKKAGDTVEMEAGSGKEKDRFRVTVKKVQKKGKGEATEDFIKTQSNGEATTLDELKSYLKSRMQEYYDSTADSLFRQDAIDALVKAHSFLVPDVLLGQILDAYVDQEKKRREQAKGAKAKEPLDETSFREEQRERATNEAKWMFLYTKLEDSFSDIEITAEDIDANLSKTAAQYGLTLEQIKSFYVQNPSQLESIRNSIREDKIFERIQTQLSVKELDKDAYNKSKEKGRSFWKWGS